MVFHWIAKLPDKPWLFFSDLYKEYDVYAGALTAILQYAAT